MKISNHEVKISNHEEFLNATADALDISSDMAERAISCYKAIGAWLDRDVSKLAQYDPEVYPQGSFLLGTVIRPIGDADEFDIDLVCKVKANNYDFSMSELKEVVGDELSAYATAHSMKHEPEDKRRCWTMEYADAAKFHLDVLPAIPNQQGYKLLLEQRGHTALATSDAITETAIGITDKELPQYHRKAADWPSSNPKGYAAWFHDRQSDAVEKSRKAIFEANQEKIYASVDDVPQYKVKTPLQKTIQLLKRHRDSMFENDEDKPISIIITTLSAMAYDGKKSLTSAMAYDGEESLTESLRTILTDMDSYIEERGGTFWVDNPVNLEENFADKWSEHPKRKEKFFEWLEKARKDFGAYLLGAFNKPNDDFLHSMTESTLSRVLSMAAPALASKDETLQKEADHLTQTGATSKPWCRV